MTAYIISGLVLGSIYAIAGLGLVLTYTSSRIFNFAHGAMAFFVAFCFHDLRVERDWSLWSALVVSVLVIAPLLGLVAWGVLFRHLTNSPAHIKIVATIGLFVGLPSATVLLFDSTGVSVGPSAAPGWLESFKIGDVTVTPDQVVVVLVAALVALGATVFFRFVPAGMAVRAVVDSPEMAMSVGAPSTLIAASSWAVGAMLAGLCGVLMAPIFGLQSASFNLLVVASFAAVVIARFHNMVAVFLGAVGIGLVQQILVRYLPDTGFLSRGARSSIPFVVMLIVLLLYWWRGIGQGDDERRAPAAAGGAAPPTPAPVHPIVGLGFRVVVLVAVGVTPLLLSDFWTGSVALGFAMAVIMLSYTVLLGEVGVTSLGQAAFAGIGAIAAAQFATVYGWPLLPAVLCGALMAVPFGMLVALPALRLGQLYLALVTLGFAFLMESMIFTIERFEKSAGLGERIARPELLGIDFREDTALAYLFLGVYAVVAVGVTLLKGRATGMVMDAVRNSPKGAASLGIGLLKPRLIGFGLSSFVAGLGGALVAIYLGNAGPASFGTLAGLFWLAVIVVVGTRSVVAALVAGVMVAVAPQIVSIHFSGDALEVPNILFGLAAIGLAREPDGIVAEMRNAGRAIRSLAARISGMVRPDAPGGPVAPTKEAA